MEERRVRPSPRRAVRRTALALLALALFASLAHRWRERGPYAPGWDVLSAAHGAYVLSQSPPGEAVQRLSTGVYDFRYWNATDSLPYTLLPGLLARTWPWTQWADLLTLVLVLATFGLLLRVSDLGLRGAWLLALAWCASPALLSFAICGYPYATGFLPHALALAIVTSTGLRARPALTLLAALFACELSWHFYEAGKTLVVVFVAAAVFERGVRLPTRAAWLAAAALQTWRVLGRRGWNVDYVVSGAQTGGTALAEASARTLSALVRPEVDLPLLVPLALLSLPLVRRRRALLACGLASQVALVAIAASMEPTAIRPRRLLTTTFYAIALLATAWRDTATASAGWRRTWRHAVVLLLAAGALGQLALTWRFFRVPPAARAEPLPFTASKDDYFVAAGATDAARQIVREVGAGRSVVVLHNLSSEPLADPSALLERTYLSLGHESFSRSVLAFGAKGCRYACVPVHPLEEVLPRLDALAAERREAVALYSRTLEPRRHTEESALVFTSLAERFELLPAGDAAAGFGRLLLRPRRTPPVEIEGVSGTFPVDLSWHPDPRVPGAIVSTAPRGMLPFRHEWSGAVTVPRATTVDVLLGCDGSLQLEVGARLALAHQSAGVAFWRDRLDLPAGRSRLRLRYDSRSGSGRLVFRF